MHDMLQMRQHRLLPLTKIGCGVNRFGDSGVHTLGDTSAFVNPTGQLLIVNPAN